MSPNNKIDIMEENNNFDEDIDGMPDRVGESFAGKTLLITGGTGFMGKVLVEKILRCAPKVDTIYLLVRPKKGKDPQERLKDIFSSPLYELVRNMRGGLGPILDQVKAVEGDVAELKLGLSEKDRELLASRVNGIYHLAATIRFDEGLRKAVLLNTRGTKLMLELAKQCKNLQFFAYVSTSYCHLHVKLLLEQPYDPPANPHTVIKCAEWMDNDIINKITPQLLGNLPNTYAFTKALSEGLVNEQFDNLPVIILRPSIVIPIWKEPLPGWTDNINGPTGLLIGAGKGVIRTMYCDDRGYADYIPVDVAANGMMLAFYNVVGRNDLEHRVFHFTSSSEIKVPWREIIEMGRKIIQTKMPLNGVAWYPGGSMKSNYYVHKLCVLLFHYLPAILVDTLLYLLRYEPVLWRVQRRVDKGFEVFEYYANNQWDFANENVYIARKVLNARERQIYKIDSNDINLEEYFTNCIHAARLYILKETDDTIPAARRHMRVMWWVGVFTQIAFIALLVYMVSGYITPFFS